MGPEPMAKGKIILLGWGEAGLLEALLEGGGTGAGGVSILLGEEPVPAEGLDA